MRALLLMLAALACAPAAAAAAGMELTSPDLTPNGTMPAAHVYTRCGGANVSPALAWRGQPAAAKSLAVTMIDLSVKPALWSHWIVVGLPPATSSLPRGVAALPAGAKAIAGNFGDAAYDGPCPPTGSGVHRYQITVWAMPTASVAVAPDAPASEVLAMLSRSSIDHASLTVTAQR
jgi:hypothetical protein